MNAPTVLPTRRVSAVLLVVAPLCEIVEAALSPLIGTSTRADLPAIAAHQGRFELSVGFGLLGTLLLVPAFFGLMQACCARTPRLATISAWVMFGCMAGFLAVRTTQAVELSTIEHGVPTAQAAKLVDGIFATPIAAPLIVMFLLGNVVGLILIAVTAWRAGLPRVGSLALVAFMVLELAGFTDGELMTIVSHTVLLLATSTFAVALWGRSVEVAAAEAALVA